MKKLLLFIVLCLLRFHNHTAKVALFLQSANIRQNKTCYITYFSRTIALFTLLGYPYRFFKENNKNKPPKYLLQTFRWPSPLNTFKQNEISNSCRKDGCTEPPSPPAAYTAYYFLASAI